jgi:uncharacterized membrane protein
MTGRRGALSELRSRLRGSLWPLPVVAIVLAIALGTGLPALDEVLEQPGGDHPLTFVFGGGPSAARDLLAAIAGSLISVTGLTFSFTVVALQLSSSQHSPRLLQTFVTDRVVQLTLAQLVGTFVYALTVLRTVRTEDAASGGFAVVPRLSVTVGFALTLVSVVALVLFLGHLAVSLRVETMLRDVHAEATATYDRELPDPDGDHRESLRVPEEPPRTLAAASSGFVVDVDHLPVVRAARDADATVLLAARIGDSVVAGTPFAHVWTRHRTDTGELEDTVQAAVRLGFERSPGRDIAYSLRKVVDIAVRALSPGTNDPTTAVHAMSHVSALLGELVARPAGPQVYRDDAGEVRLVVPQWDVAALLQVALEEPLQFSTGQPAVLRRIAGVLREVAWRGPRSGLDDLLCPYLAQVVEQARETTAVTETETARWERAVQDALSGRWAPER